MRAVVLVGGAGTRLRPLTLTSPKQMLPVAEVPMIERVLGHLANHGVDDVVLSMGYRPDAFLASFPDDTCAGVKLSYAVEPEPLDTAGGIAFAARSAGVTEPFLAVNGDILTDLDVSALIAFHEKAGAEATIALTPVDDPSEFGVVPTDADGRVTAFIEKPAPGQAPTNLINAGFYVLQPSVLERVAAGSPVNIERETFPALAEGGSLFALASRAYWTDTGTPALYLEANMAYLRGEREVEPAPGAKEREPGVWTLGAAVIEGKLVGPCLVGDAAFIGEGARAEGSVVGGGARLEPGATVEGSLLLPGAVVRAGAEVSGSIVGDGAVVGEDAKVTGLAVLQAGARVPAGAIVTAERVMA